VIARVLAGPGGRVLAVVALLSATACSGPEAPLRVGMNSRPVDLLLGQRIRVVTELVAPPVSPSFAPTGYLDDVLPTAGTPLRRPRGPAGPVTPIECPTAPADAAILTPKTPVPPGPPASATYTYRVKGSVTVAGHVRALPSALTRDVANIHPDPPAAYLFDAFDSMDSETAVTSYRLVPDWYPVRPPTSTLDVAEGTVQTQTGQQAPGSPVGSREQPGLYIVRLAASDPGLRLPEPGIKLVEFPVAAGAAFTTAATDGVTTVSYTSTVNPVPARVDACGVLLDIYRVDVVGEITKSTSQDGYVRAQFNASYGVATQFGALVVWEKVDITSADVSRTLEATINQEPARPQPAEGQG
jgi:hypothetical protein